MNRLTIIAAAAALMLLAPTPASAIVVGQVGIGYENAEFDFDSSFYFGDEYSYDGPNLDVAIADHIAENVIVQGSGRLQSQSGDYGGEGSTNYEENTGHMALYVAYRNEAYTIGGFYSMENYYGHDIQQIGADGQIYFDGLTLEGSAAYGNHDGPYWDEYEAWDVMARLTGYINDQWAVTGGLGYAKFDYYGGETELTTVDVTGEYWIPNSPYSIELTYAHGEGEDTYTDYSADVFALRFVLNFGAENAQDRDQHGASLTGAESFDLHWRMWQRGYYD